MNGAVSQFVAYTAYGETFVEERNTDYFLTENYKYNGKELDEETGLYYYGARYYDPKVSNWLSVDPIALYDPINETEHYLDGQHNGGYFNPANLSVYGYTYQNPIKYVDPNGKQSLVTEPNEGSFGARIVQSLATHQAYNAIESSNIRTGYNNGASKYSKQQGGYSAERAPSWRKRHACVQKAAPTRPRL